MKLNFGKKLVLFLHWLMSLIACAIVVVFCVWPQCMQSFFSGLYSAIGKLQADVVGIVLLAVYALLAAASVVIIFSGRRRSDRGFITVDSSEAGRTRIAVGAVEQMIRQAVRGVDGIAEMKAGIVNSEDSISINVNVAILSGAHVPTVTMNIQRAIRSYIELNCGVAVREVCVNVHALESSEEGAKRGRRKAAQTAAQPTAQAAAWQPSASNQTESRADSDQPPVTNLPEAQPAEATVAAQEIAESAQEPALEDATAEEAPKSAENE